MTTTQVMGTDHRCTWAACMLAAPAARNGIGVVVLPDGRQLWSCTRARLRRLICEALLAEPRGPDRDALAALLHALHRGRA